MTDGNKNIGFDSLIKGKDILFLGIGGIGMSAIARYLLHKGCNVRGYDRTRTELTDTLSREGVQITYDEQGFAVTDNDVVIYTPAIPKDNLLLTQAISKKVPLFKRSEILGMICGKYKTIAVAGTHGKTTISGMIAHILAVSDVGCQAFLGGISKNFNSNVVIDDREPEFMVAEADEFDRSFLQLSPFFSIISATSEDHLDIYGTKSNLLKSFEEFAEKTNKNGCLFMKYGLPIEPNPNCEVRTYALDNLEADYYAWNVRLYNQKYYFDFHTPEKVYFDMALTYPGRHNIENSLVALAVCLACGVKEEDIRKGLESFNGIKRRFDVVCRTNDTIYIDDYAHHPEEIAAFLQSVKEFYPNKKITCIFQPHLFTRTRDFLDNFALSLELADEILLLDIYPARENPIKGVDSGVLFRKINKMNKYYLTKEQLLELLPALQPEILVSIGAGDIDKLIEPITNILKQE
ncbi:MAG: UDP-N-acetylmuramate--L-alanine ligase [Bacteroidales bacterium]|jgi:UDP-N-acetylmuramate--alanine ligase|nr:UDP-N-acetylmuramate--L-alanine ligase [Bacteroidales bacterium]